MYHTIPENPSQAAPVLQRTLQEMAAAILPLTQTRKRPDPPRSLIAQAGTAEALISWNAPAKANDIAGWKVYKDNENNLYAAIRSQSTRQIYVSLPANSQTYVYVSSVNSAGRESIKVQILAKSDTNQYVTTGTGGATSGTSQTNPPGYSSEPTGGSQLIRRGFRW